VGYQVNLEIVCVFNVCVYFCPEIYNNVAATNVDCRLCSGTSTPSMTGSLDRHGDNKVCPRCSHAFSDAAAVDKFTRHSECLSAVSFRFCVYLF